MSDEEPKRLKRDLSKLGDAGKDDSEQGEHPPPETEAHQPKLVIRQVGTDLAVREIGIQRGMGWQDVNALVSTIMTQPGTMKAGLWLDMREAYWEQATVR